MLAHRLGESSEFCGARLLGMREEMKGYIEMKSVTRTVDEFSIPPPGGGGRAQMRF